MDVAFDRDETNATNYRFGSVGQDGKLLLWDFETRPARFVQHSTNLKISCLFPL
eukprot:m.170927 g.170927  ORF g.170927 m.170927 type:complete len:54 (-) comp15342_c0_seq11:72-233(-)